MGMGESEVKRQTERGCCACGERPVSLYGCAVDGVLLHLQVRLCPEHGAKFLIAAGMALGRIVAGVPTALGDE
jgi:hypothetical protein